MGVRLGGSHPLPYILLIRQEVGGKWLDWGGGQPAGLQSCLGMGDTALGQDSGPASHLPTC